MVPLAHPRLWLFAGILLVISVVTGSLLPVDNVEEAMVWNDKVTHALAYTVLTLWFAGIFPKSHYPLIALAMFALGALIETLQQFMPFGRQGEVADLIANSAGILFGWLLAVAGLGGWARSIESRLQRGIGS